jgi:uncharacterized protein YkwD
MGFGGGRRIAVFACALAALAVTAPAALSSQRESRAVTSLDEGVLHELNAIRIQYGLVPLRQNAQLAAAAAQHSLEMTEDGYFSHSSFDGTSFSTRISHFYNLSRYSSWAVGENLLWSSPSINPAGAVRMWMRSPGHRENILNAGWREIGVAAVHAPRAGGTFGKHPVTVITTDFGVRR